MEIFVDFGLFEIVVALGLSAVARHVYTHRLLRVVFLILSLAAPVALLFLAPGAGIRWVAALALATTLVNLSLVVAILQTGEIPRLEFRRAAAAPSPLGVARGRAETPAARPDD